MPGRYCSALSGCLRCYCSIRSMWSGDIIEPALSPEGIAAILTEESPMPFANLRWYPADIRGKRYPDVPMQIAAAASEAHRCIAVEVYRGAVLLARSVIEA